MGWGIGVFLAAWFLWGSGPAKAAPEGERMECYKFLERVKELKDFYIVSLLPDGETIRASTADYYCEELGIIWSGRPGVPASPRFTKRKLPPGYEDGLKKRPGEVGPTPYQTHPFFARDVGSSTLPTGANRADAERVPQSNGQPPASEVPPCDRTLDQFWNDGIYYVGATPLWLARVFTLDMNSDGVIDNVGFQLKADGYEDVNLRYFAPEGETAAKDIQGLDIFDDNAIWRLCFGQVSFSRPQMPGDVSEEEQVDVIGAPDLANPDAAREKDGGQGEEQKPAASAPDDPDSGTEGLPMWIWWTLGGVVAVIVVGGGLFFLGGRLHKKAKRRREIEKHFGDEDDYEDAVDTLDDGDQPAKRGAAEEEEEETYFADLDGESPQEGGDGDEPEGDWKDDTKKNDDLA